MKDEQIQELKRLWEAGEAHGSPLITFAVAQNAIYLAFPALLERLERAEAERDELRQGIESANTAAAHYYGMLIRNQQELAARDDRMKREGAAESLFDLANGRFGDGLFLPDRVQYTAAEVSEILTAEAQRLREEK